MPLLRVLLIFLCLCSHSLWAQNPNPSAEQLAKWLKRFPAADTNDDGQLTSEEAVAFLKQLQQNRRGGGAPRTFEVDPGWDAERFPDHAVCYKTPDEIREIYASTLKGKAPAMVSYEKPENGALRVIGTGHSFMAPGYKTLPKVTKAAGFEQPLYTHTGGGMTGSARYKWEQENGIFEFDQKPVPKLLASLANAEWDVMFWGPYFQDRPVFYSCWIEFSLKYQPEMKFYLSDAWPQMHQLEKRPASEAEFTEATFDQMGAEKNAQYGTLVEILREEYGERIFILPTSDAMVLAAKHYLRGELPGVEGINRILGGKERSLWRDELGHLGPGFERLEGYVFYATLYGESPELIEGEIGFGQAEYPSAELDAMFRQIAWKAVIGNPLSGVKDVDGDGLADSHEG